MGLNRVLGGAPAGRTPKTRNYTIFETGSRQLIFTGSPYADVVGFSRAVRVGNIIAVGGTAPLGSDGETVAPGDAAAQARRCIEIVQEALQEAGASLNDVVQTRVFLKRIENWKAVAEVRAEYFGEIKPVDTLLQVTGFVDPEGMAGRDRG